MAATNKESVYITVEALGVQKAVKDIEKLSGSLGGAKGVSNKEQQKALATMNDNLKDIRQTLEAMNRRQLISGLMRMFSTGGSEAASSLVAMTAGAKALGSRLAALGADARKALPALESFAGLSLQLNKTGGTGGIFSGSLTTGSFNSGLKALEVSTRPAVNAIKSLEPAFERARVEAQRFATEATASLGNFSSNVVGLNKSALLLGGSLAALTAALVYYVKTNHDDLKTYQKLNPEVNTYINNIKNLKDATQDYSTAVSSLFGETWHKLTTNVVTETYRFFEETKQKLQIFWAEIFEGGQEKFKMLGALIKSYIYQALAVFVSVFDTMPEAIIKRIPPLKKAVNAVRDTIAQGIYEADQEYKKAFASGSMKSRFDEQVKRAEALRTGAGNDKSSGDKGNKEHKKAKNEADDFTNLLSNLTMEDGGFWDKKLLGDFNQLKETYAAQLDELNKQTAFSEEERNQVRLALEEDFLNKSKEIQLANARAVGDNEFIIAQQLEDAKKAIQLQNEQERLAREKALQEELEAQEKARMQALMEQQRLLAEQQKAQMEWLQSNLTGPLANGITGLITTAMEGTEDIGQAAFNMLYDLSKNIFTSSLSQLINAGLLAIANQYESNSKLGLPGLAIATVASGVITGIMAGLKAKMQPPKMQAAVGGYVSAGMVRGAYSSGDSVSALLQPGERVLSKEETKRYDEKQNNNQNLVVNVTINGLLNTPSQIDQTVRQSLIPAIRRAVQQGYALGV